MNSFLTALLACFAAACLMIFAVCFHFTRQKKVVALLKEPFTFTIFLLIYCIFPFCEWHPQHLVRGTAAPTSVIIRLAVYAAITILFRSWFRRSLRNLLIVFKDPFLSILILLAIVSSLWSLTPALSLRSVLAAIIITLLAAHIANLYQWSELSRFLRWSFLVIAVLSIIVTLGLPSVGKLGSIWRGVVTTDKALSNLMALNTALWLWHGICQPRYFWRSISVSALSIILMLLGRGKTGLIACFVLVFIVMILYMAKSLKPNQAVVAVTCSLVIGILGTIWLQENADSLFLALGKDSSLSGRTDFWPQLWEKIRQHPFGYGYAGFWQPWLGDMNPSRDVFNPGGLYAPPHSHNGLFEIGLQLGFLGIGLYILSFTKVLAMMALCANRLGLSNLGIPILLLVYLIATNLSETEQLGLIGPNYTWFYFVLISVRLSLDQKEKSLVIQ